ncbi:MAG: sugar kinase [Defluviitaleaceae bacterium]|nr:sugar kinase [Defluviitaleaceae bacterium]
MKKIVTFGEIMLRLAPPGYERFTQCNTLGATYGGGEANVAVSLSNYGFDAAFVTKLPKHEMGQSAVNSLRRYGVDTNKIVRGGDRVGIYFLEKGSNQRPSKVVYDRANSAIAMAKPEDFDWNAILDGVDWFHFTGITPALGQTVADICLDALKACKDKGITTSCDLNYRKNLWTKAEAKETMSKLMPYVNLCIANEEDASDVFGITSDGTDVTSGHLNHDGYKSVARQLVEKFGFKHVAITLRESHSANHNDWSAMLYDGKDAIFSRKYEIKNIVDRVGGGDSFGGGLIYGFLSGKDLQGALEFAVAASCLKHTIEGDFNLVSVAEVTNLLGGDGSGRVQR